MPTRAAPLVIHLAVLLVVSSGSSVHATDPNQGLERARTLAILAEGRLAAGLPAEAAPLYERAADLDPRPSFWVAAAMAWIDATHPERAVAAFERALALATPAARSGLEDQRRLAQAMAALTVEARRATADGRHAAAADRWYEAAALSGSHRFELEAARALSRARRIQALRLALPRLIERSDWSADERALLDDLQDQAQAYIPPPPPDMTNPAPWVLIGAGAAVAVFGVTALFVGDDARRELRAAERAAIDGRIEDLTRADALALESTARTWNTVGLVATGLGVALVATGSTWLAVAPGQDGAIVTVGARL